MCYISGQLIVAYGLPLNFVSSHSSVSYKRASVYLHLSLLSLS